jgi:hypothetical protein
VTPTFNDCVQPRTGLHLPLCRFSNQSACCQTGIFGLGIKTDDPYTENFGIKFLTPEENETVSTLNVTGTVTPYEGYRKEKVNYYSISLQCAEEQSEKYGFKHHLLGMIKYFEIRNATFEMPLSAKSGARVFLSTVSTDLCGHCDSTPYRVDIKSPVFIVNQTRSQPNSAAFLNGPAFSHNIYAFIICLLYFFI